MSCKASSADFQREQVINFSVQYASIALLFYDYFLTWTREVNYVWRKKFTISTALYFSCRYAMISNILYLIALTGKLPVCIRICCAISFVGRAGILTVIGARTYALFDRSKWILVIFGPLGVVIMAIAAVHIRWVVCVGSPENRVPEDFMAIVVIVYEILAAVFTVFRGWQALRIRVDLNSGLKRLEYLVVQQGVLYFCFVSLFTLSSLVLLYKAPNGSVIQRLFNGLTLPISGLMTARFILHLREWEHKITMASTVGSVLEPIEFQRPASTSDHGERSRISSMIDEFGRCPVRQARIERESIPNDLEEV